MKHVKNEGGVGLIEVLVTLLILSTTLIALSALQTRSLQFNQGAYFRTQANMLAYDMLDRIRVNDSLVAKEKISEYTMAETAASAATSDKSPLSKKDKNEWLKSIGASLPSGKGKITCNDNSRICRVEVTWSELNSSGLADEDASRFSFEARI